jgi:hypothetical protein
VGIPDGFWLKFNAKERKFLGTPSKTLWYKEYTLIVSGTDGYTEVNDEFHIMLRDFTIELAI